MPFDWRTTARLLKQLDEEREAALEQLKHPVYFHRQAAWLRDRFPEAELQAVGGLAKLVDRNEIEAADWSLTPRRYVGVPRRMRTRTSTSSRPCATSTPSCRT